MIWLAAMGAAACFIRAFWLMIVLEEERRRPRSPKYRTVRYIKKP